jgi:hypothetical protein
MGIAYGYFRRARSRSAWWRTLLFEYWQRVTSQTFAPLQIFGSCICTRRMTILAAMGFVTGMAALFRFNMASLGFIGIWVADVAKSSRPAWQRMLVFDLLAGIAVSPWLIRNRIAFHGKVLYATLSGHDAVEGVLTPQGVTPQGRALPANDDKIEAAEGWLLSDIESNRPSRLHFPSEAELNQKAWRATEGLWK